MRWLGWVGVLFVAACSRTALFDLPGPGVATATGGAPGVGGSAGTTASGGAAGVLGTGGTTGTGGGGGFVHATGTTCHGFLDHGPRFFKVIGTEPRPELVFSSDNGQRVSVVYEEDKSFGGSDLGQVAFAAWAAWPMSVLGQATTLISSVGHQFSVAPSFANRFALLGQRRAGRLFVSIVARPGPYLGSIDNLGQVSDRPMFIARGDADHMLGWMQRHDGDHWSARFARVPGLGPLLPNSGCATAPLSADAVREGNHYVVVFTTSRDFGACAPSGSGDSLPTRIQIADQYDGGAFKLAQLEPPAQGQVYRLRTVSRSGGLWLVWQIVNQIMVGRLDPQGNLVTLPNSFASTKLPDAWGADRMGDDLALAYVQANATTRAVEVKLFSKDSVGSAHLGYAIDLDPALPLPAHVTVLGSPDGDHLLVSWDTDTASGNTEVVTHRLDCVQAN